jgi:hypothetical protein
MAPKIDQQETPENLLKGDRVRGAYVHLGAIQTL